MEKDKERKKEIGRTIFLFILFFNALLFLLMEKFIIGFIFSCIFIWDFYINRLDKLSSLKKNKMKISEDVAKAMASKIIFEAEQNRKKKDGLSNIKIGHREEE